MGITVNARDLEQALKDLAKTTPKKADKALQKASEYMVEQYQQAAIETFTKTGRSTGRLAQSIGKKKTNLSYDIFPKGKAPKSNGKRKQPPKPPINMAGVGAVLEYGRSNLKGTAWWSKTTDIHASKAVEIMKKELTDG